MMARTEATGQLHADLPEEPRRHPVCGVLLMIAAVFFVGIVGGLTAATIDHADGRPDAITIAIGLAALLASIGCVVVAVRLLRPLVHSPGSRTGRSQWSLIASGALGLLLYPMLHEIFFVDLPSFAVDDAATHTPAMWAVVGALVVTLAVIPALTWVWHRNADELQRGASADGAVIAGYALILGSAAWLIGWRGGLLPEPEAFAILVAYTFIWIGTWAIRMFR